MRGRLLLTAGVALALLGAAGAPRAAAYPFLPMRPMAGPAFRPAVNPAMAYYNRPLNPRAIPFAGANFVRPFPPYQFVVGNNVYFGYQTIGPNGQILSITTGVVPLIRPPVPRDTGPADDNGSN